MDIRKIMKDIIKTWSKSIKYKKLVPVNLLLGSKIKIICIKGIRETICKNRCAVVNHNLGTFFAQIKQK